MPGPGRARGRDRCGRRTGRARHRLRRAQLLRRRQGRRDAPGIGPSRSVPDRRPQDLRARLRRHDRLGQGTRTRRGAQRHPAPRRAGHRCAHRHGCDLAPRLGRRGRRDQCHARPRLRAVDPRRRPRVLARHRCGLPRSRRARVGRRFAHHRRVQVGRGRRRADPRPGRRVRVRDPHRAGRRPDPADAVVDGRAPHARRDPLARHPDRHHQLRDARTRPAAARLRPRHAHRRHHRAACERGGEVADPRRQGPRPPRRGPADHRRVGADRPGRSDGRRHDRDDAVDPERADRGGDVRSRHYRPHRAPAQAAVRGLAPLRARRGPERPVRRRPARGGPHGRLRGRHRRPGGRRAADRLRVPRDRASFRIRRGTDRRRLHAR